MKLWIAMRPEAGEFFLNKEVERSGSIYPNQNGLQRLSLVHPVKMYLYLLEAANFNDTLSAGFPGNVARWRPVPRPFSCFRR
jgi:hypothetical protein